MKQFTAQFLTLGMALALGGCVSPYGWSEAPMDDRYYGSGAPVGWWGSDAASVEPFYGALSGYGNWASHDRYGRVFLPANVGAGWQPYSQGYWRNDSRYGRMWVSSEPWGWATYHYGRWGRDSRLGWFWVPDTRFGPGWVDWRAGNGYNSWAPLPPYGWNSYGYGYGNNWWVNAPGSWAYRPGMYQHLRPGRHDWYDRDRPGNRPPRPGEEPPRARPDKDAVIGSYVRKQVNPRQQVAPPTGVAPSRGMMPLRGMAPPRGPRPELARQPRPEAPRAAATQAPRVESSRGSPGRGQPSSGGSHPRGRDAATRTQEQ